MRLQFLGPNDPPLLPSTPWVPEWAISHGYRHIIPDWFIERLKGRVINLHISYLPWNRGADPNLWSFVDDTPKGVSIHYVDSGIDTGDLIYQRPVEPIEGDTLRSSYDRLQNEMRGLFNVVWPLIVHGEAPRTPQPPGGSYHTQADRQRVEHLLTAGWDTPVAQLLAARTSE